MSALFEPLRVGAWSLRNRIVMAPMTRNRAAPTGIPTPDMAIYYGQRASAGLIITEGTQPSPAGQGYLNTPGLHSPEQQEGWARVAEAVHSRGGRVVAQLMHAGRISHPANKHGAETVAPSALAAHGTIFTPDGSAPYPIPRQLDTDDVLEVVQEFVDASTAALDAGLDGVELHAANGYLPHQFLSPTTNRRSDTYGGTPLKRTRFLTDTVHAIADAIGAGRLGVRISPGINLHGALETNVQETESTYRTLVDALSQLGLAYLHTIGHPDTPILKDLLQRFNGITIVNTGWDPVTDLTTATGLIDSGRADLIAVGRPFIANPDLVERWQNGHPLNTPDASAFYGGTNQGYTDYPTLDASGHSFG